MSRAPKARRGSRMSELRPWMVGSPLLGRLAAFMVLLALPFIALGFGLWHSLKRAFDGLLSPWLELKDDWQEVKEALADLVAITFRRWENDL